MIVMFTYILDASTVKIDNWSKGLRNCLIPQLFEIFFDILDCFIIEKSPNSM